MKTKTTQTFTAYAGHVGRQLIANNQERTGQAYLGVVRRFAAFLGKEEVNFSDFTATTMIRFQEMLLKQGRTLNTVSYYMRNLRVIYKRAYRDGVVKKKCDGVFDAVFTRVDDTLKRALTQEELDALSALQAEDKTIYECLLYFLFCFHGRGISFVDMCFLRKTHIRHGAIYYCRKKTGKQLVIKITQPMQEILDYFSDQVESSPFLFPILNEQDTRSLRAQYENALCKQNRRLKVVSKLAGIPTSLSTHVARHTWATIAYQDGAGLSVVSQALGHRDERTTAIYLASFKESVIDKVSERVSGLVKQNPTFVPRS